MPTYTMTSTKWEGEIKLSFFENGFIQSAEFPEVIDRKAVEFFASHFPVHESLMAWYKENSSATITLLDTDTSFDAFWDAYARKSGSKELARQYWDGEKKTINRRPITLTDRQEIMKMVKWYSRRYQGEKKEYQPLASSFLHGRMWESEIEGRRKSDVDLSGIWKKQQ